MSLRFPDIVVPFPLRLNPAVEEVERHSRRFVRQFSLVRTAQARRHHDRSLMGTLMCRAYPDAEVWALELITDWMSCNLVLDDRFDETELGRAPERMERECERVLSWLPLEGPREPSEGDGFAAAYTDLWTRTCAVMSPRWRRRFVADFASFLDCCCWESRNRLAVHVPSLAEYRPMRARALMPYLDLIELANGAELPDEVVALERWRELNRAISEAVLWTNDLFSCEKEELFGDGHNLVTIIEHEQGLDLQAAADRAGAMIQERIDRFVALAEQLAAPAGLTQLAPAARAVAVRHIDTMRSWLRGQLQWRYETGRFDPDPARAAGVS